MSSQPALKPFHFDVDVAHARQHNEYQRDARRLQVSAVVFGFVLLGVGIAGYFLMHGDTTAIFFTFIMGMLAIISWILVPVIPRKVGSPQELYDRYDLIPAVVVKVNPHDIELLALVNLNADPYLPPRWGLASRVVASVPGVKRVVGARVPSAAVTLMRSLKDRTTWDEINPMPIGWATADHAVLRAAEKAIPSKQWALLEQNVSRRDEVRAAKMHLLPLEKK